VVEAVLKVLKAGNYKEAAELVSQKLMEALLA
jgi:hypothetical protein